MEAGSSAGILYQGFVILTAAKNPYYCDIGFDFPKGITLLEAAFASALQRSAVSIATRLKDESELRRSGTAQFSRSRHPMLGARC